MLVGNGISTCTDNARWNDGLVALATLGTNLLRDGTVHTTRVICRFHAPLPAGDAVEKEPSGWRCDGRHLKDGNRLSSTQTLVSFSVSFSIWFSYSAWGRGVHDIPRGRLRQRLVLAVLLPPCNLLGAARANLKLETGASKQCGWGNVIHSCGNEGAEIHGWI